MGVWAYRYFATWAEQSGKDIAAVSAFKVFTKASIYVSVAATVIDAACRISGT